jgi:hypothetical protein
MSFRYLIAGALIYFVFSGVKLPGVPSTPSAPSGPYTGSMSALHEAAGEMDANDRAGLSEALEAASKMVSEDKAGLLSTTEALQKASRGAIAFGYSTFSVKRYSKVAALIQADLEKAVGSEVAAVSPEVRGKVASTLSEAARAVR